MSVDYNFTNGFTSLTICTRDKDALIFQQLILLALFVLSTTNANALDDYRAKRDGMLNEIQSDTQLTSISTGKPHFDQRVMDAMRAALRDKFVRAGDEKHA